MKKKLFLLFIMLCFCSNAFAEEEFDFFDRSAMDAFNNPRKVKPANDKDVERAFQQLQARKDRLKYKRHFWEKKPEKLKGDPLQGGIGDNVIKKPYLLLEVTQPLNNGEVVIPQGFYTVSFDDEKDTLFLKQGYSIIAAVRMSRTPIEPKTDDLYYIQTKPQKEGVKFFYGAIDKHYEGFCNFER